MRRIVRHWVVSGRSRQQGGTANASKLYSLSQPIGFRKQSSRTECEENFILYLVKHQSTVWHDHREVPISGRTFWLFFVETLKQPTTFASLKQTLKLKTPTIDTRLSFVLGVPIHLSKITRKSAIKWAWNWQTYRRTRVGSANDYFALHLKFECTVYNVNVKSPIRPTIPERQPSLPRMGGWPNAFFHSSGGRREQFAPSC